MNLSKRIFVFALFLPFALRSASLPGAAAVTVSGSFSGSGSAPVLNGSELVKDPYFGEWPNRASNGRASTGAFDAPQNLECEVVGYPTHPGLRIFLEDAATPTQQLALTVMRDSGPTWFTRRWHIPPEWQRRRVRLVVEDKASDNITRPAERWVGFTLPREYKIWNIHTFAYAEQAMRRLAFQWVLLVLPGIAFALWFSRRKILSPEVALAAIFAVCGVSGLLAFFVFVFSVSAGKLYSIAVPLVSAATVFLYRKRLRSVLIKPIGGVLVLWLFASALYLSAGLLYRNEDGFGEYVQDRFFSYHLPPDNVLPLILSNAIYKGAPFRPAFFADIQSSDRPPLQSGFTLLQLIFWHKPDDQYLFLGVLLQTSWIPALWTLLRSMRVNGPPMLAAIAMTAFSQFAFIHELFVWPKLLSAAFGLLALSRFSWVTKQQPNRTDAVLAGVLGALAMVSHGGVLMTVLGFGIFILVWHRPTWKWLLHAALASFLIYLPWVLYQKLFDPPGDALLKLHLAGEIDRSHGLGWLIWNKYSHLGLSGWMANKWTNLKFLFWSSGGYNLPTDAARRMMSFSHASFYSLFPGLGLANAGFLLRYGCAPGRRAAPDRLMAIAAASLGVWLLIMYAPQSTTIHQGSFVMMILLFAALTLFIADFSPKLALILVTLQCLEFVTIAFFGEVWIRNDNSHISDVVPDAGMFTTFSILLIALAAWFAREWQRKESLYT